MKTFSWLLRLTAMVVLVLVACSKKADVKSSVTQLEQSLTSAPSPAQSQPNSPSPAAQAEANALLRSAVAAAQANDYAGGVIALQAAQQKPGLNADQILAAQRAQQTMVGELQRRADNGDQAALAQLKAIEKTRSQ